MTQPVLDRIVSSQKRGEAVGIASVCSAHPDVLEVSLLQAQSTGAPALIESTCNQVNQYGGYTGMTPSDFARYVRGIAAAQSFPENKLLLGGDHMGPNVWRGEPAQQAMDKARIMVRDYVLAGYTKIHLDPSMSCADDPDDGPLSESVVAERAAMLAEAAELAYQQLDTECPPPCYIIGTEVPPPGGIQDKDEGLSVTPSARVEETIEITWQAFRRRGLDAAWERVIAVVVQPGVEYGDEIILEYQPGLATNLSQYIEQHERLIYEAHSTDYQTRDALRHLVADHFAILKVGPALTFAYREAMFALAMIEEELLAGKHSREPSRLFETLEAAMLCQPEHWERYYHGSPEEQHLARLYSFSDRVRYYWPDSEVRASVKTLLKNLSASPIPLTLLSQYLPLQYAHIRQGKLGNSPRALIRDHITSALASYAYACGHEASEEAADKL
jgi:D-tagatose-1,6-bisphosphate aldolase subunit GatZ/KbaZ